MDTDGSGKLDREEVQAGYAEFFGKNLSEEEVDAMFDYLDTDDSGEIEYTEFVVASLNDRNLL